MEDDWDAASQSVSLDIDEDSDFDNDGPDEDANFYQEMEFDRAAAGANSSHEVQGVPALDTTFYREREQGRTASGMNLSHEFEDGPPGRSSSPEIDVAPNGVLADRIWQLRTPSPAPSYASMESEGDLEERAAKMGQEPGTNTRVQLERPDSPASTCYSFDSDDSTEPVRKTQRLRAQQPKCEPAPAFRPELKDLLAPNEKRHPAMTIPFMFKSLQAALAKLVQEELILFKWNLRRHYPECFRSTLDDLDLLNLVDKILECCGLEGSLRITLRTLTDMKLKRAADYLQELCKRNEARYDLKLSLKRKYECIFEGVAKQGQQTLFNNMFTELHITEGSHAGINKEHEVRQLPPPKRSRREVVIKCNEIFSPASIENNHIRSLLMKGIAGIGKSVCVQKFILDWAEERDHQHVYFLLPIPFRELHLMQGTEYSLMQLIHSFFPEMRELQTLDCDDCRVLFICDGLDEYQLPLDFRYNECWCDMTQPTMVDKLVTNLIKGNLLPSAHIWITSRCFMQSRVPAECVHQLVEVRGFSNVQKEEYFRKRFSDQSVANRVIEHVKSVRTLDVMCHSPLFCWITGTILERMFREAGGKQIPRTLTRFFTHYILIQLNQMKQKYRSKANKDESNRDFLLQLGRLALRMLERGQEALTENEWQESGLDFTESVLHSGLCTQVYEEEFVMYHTKMYCFVHLTVQEYLAALYVFLMFKTSQKNVLDPHLVTKLSRLLKEPKLFDVHKSAMDKALESPNGHLTVFLRFLLGLSLESNQNILRGILTPVPTSVEETIRYIRDKMRKTSDAEKIRKLSLCLEELQS
ncbi:protein NLRC3-like [Scleropages formosus]|uniref:Protein NLRC3-like n=1 Tax=Scleropages formosus TaxID=113540 RepID=A0A0P7VB59_SCLFO|nr:protein NLRC3-like [Scleropages formosus]